MNEIKPEEKCVKCGEPATRPTWSYILPQPTRCDKCANEAENRLYEAIRGKKVQSDTGKR